MPRYVATIPIAAPQPRSDGPPPELVAFEEHVDREQTARYLRTSTAEPYVPGGPWSFWRDLWRLHLAEKRGEAAFAAGLRSEPGETPLPTDRGDSLEAVQARLSRFATGERLQRRDLSSSTVGDVLRPSMPGFLVSTWGRAAAQTGQLLDVFERRPLEPGMVDTSAGVPVVKIPRLTGGPATAIQASENAALQETDAASTSVSSPVATVAGMQDMSRQLFELSQPGMDEVISDALARDFGSKADTQIVTGSASAGQTRGLLNVASILSVTGAVTSVQAFIDSVWKAFSQLAGSSGYGNPNPDDYVTILAPRRLAWIQSGTGSTTVPVAPSLPGRVVASAGIPLNLGAGTNEDVALVVERSGVVVLNRAPTFTVFEETGSATLTVRVRAHGSLAVLTRTPVAVAKVTGLTAPSGY